MLNGKTILVTGGTGSFGKRFVEVIFKKYPDIKKLIVFSRDELKQYEMSQKFNPTDYPKIRFFIGDVRDGKRLIRACEGVDIIVHAAAMKQVPTAEYNPMECINTNIIGAENIINAAMDCGVKKVVALSTDKACAPINLYGATKLCSDKLFIAANNMKGDRDLVYSVVRYGNVFASRGSVVPFFLKQKDTGTLTITDNSMTRFNITLDQGVDMVLDAIDKALGGEIFVPKIPSYRILDVAKAIAPESETEEVGIRPGEKLHEEMITKMDSLNTIDCGEFYAILPTSIEEKKKKYIDFFNGKNVEKDFHYNSADNDEWLSIEEIRELIKSQVDPNFSI